MSVPFFSLLLATMIIMCTKPIMDGDIWFHLSYGKYILHHHTLVLDHRIFSWTPTSNTVAYCQWLAQILFYVCYRIGGQPVLFAIRYLTFFAYLLLLVHGIKTNGLDRSPSAWFIALLSLIISSVAITIKPNMFSCLFMQCFVFLWYRLKTATGKECYWCYAFPALHILWVNTHGAWIFGYAFLGVAGAGEIMNMCFSRDKTLNPTVRKHFFIALALTSLATLINPYGWEYPYQVVTDIFGAGFQSQLKTNFEYASLYQQIHSLGGLRQYNNLAFLLVSLGIVGVLIRPQIKSHTPDWTILLPMFLFSFLYLSLARTVFFYASVFAFSAFHLLKSYRINRGPAQWRGKLSAIPFTLLFVGLTVYINSLNIYYDGGWLGFDIGQDVPVDEADFLKEHFHGSRIGNDYGNGSYLTWILWPGVKTSIDARNFPFEDWYDEYIQFIRGIGVDDFLKKYSCDVWCIGLEKPVMQYFTSSPEWNLIYYGPHSAIFVKEGSPLVDIRKKAVAKSITDINRTGRFLTVFNFTQLVKDFDVSLRLIERAPAVRHKPALKSRLYARLASEQYNTHSVEEASRLFLKSLKEDAGNIEALYGLGVCSFSVNDLANAEKYFRDALRINPDYKDIKKYQERILQKKKQIQEAINNINGAINNDSKNPAAYDQLGMLYEMSGSPDLAVAQYNNALALKPADLDALFRLGELYVKSGKYDNAISCYKQTLSINTDSSDLAKICYNIACLYAIQGKSRESIEWLKSAVARGYDKWDLIKADQDLNSIKGSPEYQDLIKNH